jgi:hypothetical protein
MKPPSDLYIVMNFCNRDGRGYVTTPCSNWARILIKSSGAVTNRADAPAVAPATALCHCGYDIGVIDDVVAVVVSVSSEEDGELLSSFFFVIFLDDDRTAIIFVCFYFC